MMSRRDKRGGYKRQKVGSFSGLVQVFHERGEGGVRFGSDVGREKSVKWVCCYYPSSPPLFSTSSPPLLTPSYFHSPLTHIVCSLQSRRGTHVERWLRLWTQCLGIRIRRLRSLYIRRISNYNGVNGEDNNIWSSHV